MRSLLRESIGGDSNETHSDPQRRHSEASAAKGGCGECQTSCQSACKTSCGVANQPCENNEQ